MFGKDNKLMAKMDALKGMSSALKEDSKKPMGEELQKKKMERVVVEAPDKAGLLKGLTKAEELIRAKYGEMGLDDKSMSSSEPSVDMGDDEEEEMEGMDDACPMCGESMHDMHKH